MEATKANMIFLLAESKKQSIPMRIILKPENMSITLKVTPTQAQPFS